MEFEFTKQEKYISVKAKIKQNLFLEFLEKYN